MQALVAAAVDAGGGRIDGTVTAAGVAGGGPAHLVDAAGVAARHRHQPHRHVPRGQARDRPAAHAGAGRRRARLGRHHRQHRGPRGHRRRQRVQRVEGRRGAAHQEHGHRLRALGHPRERHLPGVHRHADDRGAVRRRRHRRRRRPSGSRSTPSAASAGPRRSRRRPGSCCRATRRSCPATPWPSTAATRPAATTASPSCSA